MASDLPSKWINPRMRAMVLERLPALRGKSLLCWCAPYQACHADVLLELANGPAGQHREARDGR